jgi:hypothetical protein
VCELPLSPLNRGKWKSGIEKVILGDLEVLGCVLGSSAVSWLLRSLGV